VQSLFALRSTFITIWALVDQAIWARNLIVTFPPEILMNMGAVWFQNTNVLQRVSQITIVAKNVCHYGFCLDLMPYGNQIKKTTSILPFPTSCHPCSSEATPCPPCVPTRRPCRHRGANTVGHYQASDHRTALGSIMLGIMRNRLVPHGHPQSKAWRSTSFSASRTY
jgi:hypothetical protein